MGNDDFENPSLYRCVTGALQYVTLTWPEIAYSVNKVCQFMKSPKQEQGKLLKGFLDTVVELCIMAYILNLLLILN